MLPIKLFGYLTVILIFLLFVMGVLTYEKRGYGCYPDTEDRYRWGEKVRVLNVGNINVYATPLIKDCPDDSRYDPSRALDCGAYCTLKELNGE